MNILTLCTYPISIPQHGGQIRVRNIVDSYTASGHHVEVAGVLGSENYENEKGFSDFPGINRLSTVISNPFLMEDYAIGRLFSENQNFYEALSRSIRIKPDLIHVEQPWLFDFAFKYAKDMAPKARLIYGSQNIEWTLKKKILLSYFDPHIAQHNAELIKNVELRAIAGSDVIICVSENDARWVRTQTTKTVVIASNGVNDWQTTDAGQKQALSITKGNRYALYCASSHPPNVTGFFEIFGGGFGSLKPDEKLVIAGGAGYAIAQDDRVHQSAKLAEKIVIAGTVNQLCLQGLIEGAHCIVLPLTQGGGTNLKTAEALWAGKHIVATKIAMRGFEHLIDSIGVNVADDPISFKRTLRKTMALEPLRLTEQDINLRRSLLWDKCLEPLLALVNNLSEK